MLVLVPYILYLEGKKQPRKKSVSCSYEVLIAKSFRSDLALMHICAIHKVAPKVQECAISKNHHCFAPLNKKKSKKFDFMVPNKRIAPNKRLKEFIGVIGLISLCISYSFLKCIEAK